MKRLITFMTTLALLAPSFSFAESISPGSLVGLNAVTCAGVITCSTTSGAVSITTPSIGAWDVLGNNTSSSATPVDSTLTALLDGAFGSTRGAILERGASTWGLISPSSTTGWALTSNGTGADPTYQAVSGGSGCTVSGTANQLVVNSGSSGCSSSSATVTTAGVATWPAAGAASAPAINYTGTVFTGGTGTTTQPYSYYNQGATQPTAFSTNGTELGMNAVSGFTGNFLDLHVNGAASVFSVSSTGAMSVGTTTIAATSVLNWSGRGSLSSPAVGTVQLGNADAASPVAQIFQAQSVSTGNANTAGQNLNINGSRSNGSGASGSVIIQTGNNTASSGVQNSYAAGLTIDTAQLAILGSGTPTCGTGCSSIAAGATNQRMLVTTGTAVTSITVNFSKTFVTAPICTASEIAGTPLAIGFNAAPTTTSFTLTAASALTSTVIAVLCM